MSGSFADKKVEGFDIFKILRAVFEPQLFTLGLSSEQIERQTHEELEQSLERVNEAIHHPHSFGTLNLAVDAMGSWYVAKGHSDANMQEINMLPLLLERKQLIQNRLSTLKDQEGIENLQNLAQDVTEETVREDLQRQIEELKSDILKRQEQAKEIVQAQQQAELNSNLTLKELQVRAEIEMKKSKARSETLQSFLARESVATIVGGCLLILITVTLLIAMFLKVTPPDIITNTFLVILGYFFGQATNNALPHTKVKEERSGQENNASHKS